MSISYFDILSTVATIWGIYFKTDLISENGQIVIFTLVAKLYQSVALMNMYYIMIMNYCIYSWDLFKKSILFNSQINKHKLH